MKFWSTGNLRVSPSGSPHHLPLQSGKMPESIWSSISRFFFFLLWLTNKILEYFNLMHRTLQIPTEIKVPIKLAEHPSPWPHKLFLHQSLFILDLGGVDYQYYSADIDFISFALKKNPVWHFKKYTFSCSWSVTGGDWHYFHGWAHTMERGNVIS